jgi:O-antigen ligase
MLAFAMLIYICAVAIRTKNEILSYIVFFLILTLLNSFQVIGEGITATRRVFGFAGIMFVDYVGVSITMTFIILMTGRGKKYRILWLAGIIIFIAALLITQTRNAWLATFLTLFALILIMIIKAKKLEMRRTLLILSLTFSIFIAIVLVFTVASIKPEVSERAEETTKVEESVSKSGLIQSSLLMRFFIWHTAYTAFIEHPIIGIGAYSFPFSSQEYYKVPKYIFNEYVDGVTPHQTFFAVAVETGLLGLFAFLLFLVSSLKISFDSVNYAKTFEEKSFSLLLFSPLLYISISMTMTDAWLWGHGIILWGILLGFNLWNRKKLIEKYISEKSESLT